MRVFLALFALALLYALTLAARNGLSDLYAIPAENFLQNKRDADVTFTETEWQDIEANLLKALHLEPGNPDTLAELGRLHRIQLEDDTLDETEIARHGKLAIDYYEQSATLRPTWPWVWSGLAQVRWELYQDDSDAYHQALLRALHFGPAEGDVQRWVLELSLDTWATLSSHAQQAVMTAIDTALERTPDILDVVFPADWQSLCQTAAHGNKSSELSRLQRHCEELARIDPAL